jgi:SAM-dependent methyltransferase
MPRAHTTSRLRYYATAAVDRAAVLRPVAQLRERWIAATAPEPAQPAADGLPLPPARLRVLVEGNGDPERFLRSSATHAALVRDAVARAGVRMESLGALLDFGCGCGRTARQWAALRGPEVHGCDYNAKLVDWCRENLGFMDARVNGLEPPSPYPDDRFDLVYAISVLTHLDEPLAHRWVAEFERIVRPGGLLLVTAHGDAYRDALGKRTGPRYDAGEMVVVGSRRAGMNACAAHHPPVYVRERLLRRFEPVSFVAGGTVDGFPQDVHLVRRPQQPAPGAASPRWH